MTRAQGNFIIIAMVVSMVAAFHFYTSAENRAAIATRDYSRCWDGECSSAISNAIIG